MYFKNRIVLCLSLLWAFMDKMKCLGQIENRSLVLPGVLA